MKVLVATAAYPTADGKRPQYFVHSRNLYYLQAGINVTVLNFECKNSYLIDGIPVIGLEQFKDTDYDLLICHAANLRNHYKFLKKYNSYFKKIVFVFHGHEILHLNKYYPKPFSYVKKSKIPFFVQDCYDTLKIALWKKYWLQNIDKIRLVFVSEWIRSQFYKETGFSKKHLKGYECVISNSVGSYFENNNYTPKDIKYDFITVRANMDGSKYAVDIVVELAKKNSQYSFLLIGKGKFFEHNNKPDNLTWIDKELTHEEITAYINASRVALLPTREDTQGLMACEMATFGIPLITSNIEVCLQVLKTCKSVAYIKNDEPDLIAAIEKLEHVNSTKKWREYCADNTIMKEISYLKKLAINNSYTEE